MSEPFDPEILAILERRYIPGEEQKCRVCGGEMIFISMEPPHKTYRCRTAMTMTVGRRLGEVLDHYRQSELVIATTPDREVIALVEAYRAISTSRSETLRKALRLAEHLGDVLGSAEVHSVVCELRMEEAATRPYQPELRWAPYQEFASDPGLETMEPPAGRVTVRATGYRDNYVIIYWAGEEA